MQLIQIGTADIAQLDPLEVIPDALIWIEIRGIARKLFQLQALGGSSFEKVFDLLSSVDGRAVPDHHNLARHLAQEYA